MMTFRDWFKELELNDGRDKYDSFDVTLYAWNEARKTDPVKAELLNGLKWALDLLDMYDKRLIDYGDDVKLVYSDMHLHGKRRARQAIKAAEGDE